jgi:hypothetical protein
MLTDELLTYIVEDPTHPLAAPVSTWLAASRRFAAFATIFRDKIRKKVRTVQDDESLLDVRLELETAFLLLQEKSLSLVYEPQQIGKMRGPDFAASYTTSLTFMLEVTRLRPCSNTAQAVADAVCDKLGQLLPQHSNVLLVGISGVDGASLTHHDLNAALVRAQQRAERNDAAFLQRHHLRDRTDFFARYQRLSEVLVRGLSSEGEPLVTWVNPQAKAPLPSKVRTALRRSQSARSLFE